ncbi:hypothetical protein [Sphingomonas sp. T9W2]|uniref:hypothetical protein n=1 Tax=Sphingomonas sp. T9W2 TaxID=3143183 RepID=UPI0031F519F7
MKRYAMVRQSDSVVRRIVSADDLDTLMMNCPADCDPMPCPDTAVMPDDWQFGPSGFAPRSMTDPTPAVLRADLIAKVKQDAEDWRMRYMSPGGAKKAVYSMKQAEVEAYNALATTAVGRVQALLGLTPVARGRRFRFALAEATARGETDIAKTIDRYAAGADASNASTARIEAIEQVTVEKLLAAKTLAEMRAIYAAVKWQ